MIRVYMHPSLKALRSDESGIRRVVEAYHRYAPQTDVEYLTNPDEPRDLLVAHAGSLPGADVVINHGLYWTGDYAADGWEWSSNRDVITSLRYAREITVPSNWVAETFRREMRVSPHIIGHGIDWEGWQHKEEDMGFILWNKNRTGDVCDPSPVVQLAERFPELQFVTTFAPEGVDTPQNVVVVGVRPHSEMKLTVQRSAVYLATTKETFGIGILEAMASGVPVLGFAHGGILDLVEHGVSGYLAHINDYNDLSEGLIYCMKHRDVLGGNGRLLARQWTWEAAAEKLRAVYDKAVQSASVKYVKDIHEV